MKAIVYDRYGGPEVLELRDAPEPVVPPDGVLVRVRAVALNAMDGYFLGKPYFARAFKGWPRPTIPGLDFAGTIEAVGAGVTDFAPGDEVFGVARGALAERAVTTAARISKKPAQVSFEQAASLPVAGLTALQGLRDRGRVRPGQKVLVHGASGGVGSFALQVAKALGAEVTAVCSAPHAAQARALGADHVIDYAREDFTRAVRRYDVIFNAAGGRSWADCLRVLAPHGRFVLAGGPRKNPWFGPLGYFVRLRTATLFAGERAQFFVAQVRPDDLALLAAWVADGTLRPVLETFDWRDAREAFRRLLEGHAAGKFVLTVGSGVMFPGT
jgi:NADPH:quinone reductase-like Zn-dependent oxidoreductase